MTVTLVKTPDTAADTLRACQRAGWPMFGHPIPGANWPPRAGSVLDLALNRYGHPDSLRGPDGLTCRECYALDTHGVCSAIDCPCLARECGSEWDEDDDTPRDVLGNALPAHCDGCTGCRVSGCSCD